MNIQPRILDTPSGAADDAPLRGSAGAGNFRAALSQAVDGAGDRHRVKAGDTLYGLARARLAAAGQAASPEATMRYVRQLAQANHLSNPDRIYAGQTLVLPAAGGSAAGATSVAPRDGGVAGTTFDAAGIRALHELDWQSRLPGGDEYADISGSPKVAAADLAPSPVAAADDDELCAGAEGVPVLRRELAAYAEHAAEAGTRAVPDIVYKGVMGKMLDAVPLEPATRTTLQQANAVVSNSVTGRTLAALTGLGGPILTVAGFVWGLFSSQQIQAAQPAEPKQTAQGTTGAVVN